MKRLYSEQKHTRHIIKYVKYVYQLNILSNVVFKLNSSLGVPLRFLRPSYSYPTNFSGFNYSLSAQTLKM